MKKFMAFLLLIFAVSATAFTVAQDGKQKLTETYWVFLGDPNDPSDINDPSMYEQAPNGQPTCNSGSQLCNIYAQPQSGDPSHPDLSTEIVSERRFKN
jgi:hypothetical protein